MKPSRLCLLVSVSLALVVPSLAQDTRPKASRATIAELEPKLAALTGSETPGLSVAVGIDKTIVYAKGFGHADLENRVRVTTKTRFRIGSVSKPLTAVALGVLVEAGKLDLDAPVQKYVPSFPKKRFPITTRQLAGHLAGIRHYKGTEFLSATSYANVTAGLAIFADDPLLFEPGTAYSYSSYGWNLISAVIEGASGQPFLSYMRERVLRPLQLSDTCADRNREIIENRARFYLRIGPGDFRNAPHVDNSHKWAGGGYLGTASDLVKLGMAHLGPGFLKKPTLDVLTTSQKTRDGKPTNYGLGWKTLGPVIGHSGGSVGGTTHLHVDRKHRIVVAVLANVTRGPANGKLATRIAEAFAMRSRK